MPGKFAKQVLFREKTGKTRIAKRLPHGTAIGVKPANGSIFVRAKIQNGASFAKKIRLQFASRFATMEQRTRRMP